MSWKTKNLNMKIVILWDVMPCGPI